MRTLIVDGIKRNLSEHIWSQLCNRFDTSRVKINSFGYYNIRTSSICVISNYRCARCPLRDPHKKTNSCTYLFKKMIGEELFPYIHLFDYVIMWDPKFDSEARTAIQKVRDILFAAERVSCRLAK